MLWYIYLLIHIPEGEGPGPESTESFGATLIQTKVYNTN